MMAFQAKRKRRCGFTLFELILAVALGATLLALIGTAINLYLMRVDADRTRVEEAQLARSVLAMIADDIRGATVYQRQDTEAIAQLMAAGTPFDVDSIDQAREAMAGAGATGGTGSTASLTGGSGGSSGSSASGGSSSFGGMSSEESDETMPLGLNGAVDELYVDVTRLPRQEELFATQTGYTNAPSAASGTNPGGMGASMTATAVNPPADLKTVHYFIRQGNVVAPGSAAVTGLAPAAQASAGGLVRQEVSRRERQFAEQTGSCALGAGEVLVAPEATQIQFRYYDGTQLIDTWDMKERKQLPLAIEVSVWLRSARAATAENTGPNDPVNASRVYRQVVYLPMAESSQNNAMSEMQSSMSSMGSSSSGSSSSSTGTGTSGTGSAFGDQ
jgi:prepilin-type N-terminal cleavage/methylation domain-containing protein